MRSRLQKHVLAKCPTIDDHSYSHGFAMAVLYLKRGSWSYSTASTPQLCCKAINQMSTRSVRYRFGSHKLLYLADAMVDQPIGLEETDDGVWAIHFNNILLATFDERDYIITG